MLEKNCRFLPLKRKLGRLKRHCKDMGELMAALVKYADSDTTKDPEFEVEQPGKVKKSGSIKGQQYSPASQGGNGKRKADGHLDFVANANAQKSNQYRKGKPPPRSGGPSFNLDQLMNQPCPKHSKQDKPAAHLWKDCFIMKEYAKANSFQNNHGPGGGSGSGSYGPDHGGGGSNSGFQANQGGYNQQSGQGTSQQQQSGYQSKPKQLNGGQYHVFTTGLCKRDQKLHKRAVNTVEPTVPRFLRWSEQSIVWNREDHPPWVDNQGHLALVVAPQVGGVQVY